MEGKEIIYEFLDYISYERRYSEFTEKSYEKDLFDFFKYLKRNNLNYKKIKYNDVNKYIEELVKLGYKSSSINRIISFLPIISLIKSWSLESSTPSLVYVPSKEEVFIL